MSYAEQHLPLMSQIPVTMWSHFSPRVKPVVLQLQVSTGLYSSGSNKHFPQVLKVCSSLAEIESTPRSLVWLFG